MDAPDRLVPASSFASHRRSIRSSPFQGQADLDGVAQGVGVVRALQDMTPLEEQERLRAEFLGMVSHELRTPLTSIRGSASTLLDDESFLDPAETRQFHRIIFDQAEQMRGLISDLLNVARIETGTCRSFLNRRK